MGGLSRTHRISLIALFTALAIVLNLVIAIPAPYEPFLFYEVWEVPILLAVIVMGFRDGTVVALLNTLMLEAYKPGPLPTGPVYNLIAQLSMFVGVVLVGRRGGAGRLGRGALVTAATGLGAVLRTGVMTVVNGLVLPQPYPLGFTIPNAAVPGLLVLIGIFNFTTVLYTVPLAYAGAVALESRYPRLFESVRAGTVAPTPG